MERRALRALQLREISSQIALITPRENPRDRTRNDTLRLYDFYTHTHTQNGLLKLLLVI